MPTDATRAKELAGLIERVEKATGPDREIDADLAIVLEYPGWTKAKNDPGAIASDERAFWPEGELRYITSTCRVAPSYTSSIDTAWALVERKLPGVWYVMAKGRLTAAEPLYGCELLFNHDQQLGIASAHTQAAAVIAALLRALAGEDVQG